MEDTIERKREMSLTPFGQLHQVPKGLQVDEVVNMGGRLMQMSAAKE